MRDGCEWDPATGTPARGGDEHNSSVPAALIVGADGKWRLCTDCAELPEFSRYRKRRPVRRLPGCVYERAGS